MAFLLLFVSMAFGLELAPSQVQLEAAGGAVVTHVFQVKNDTTSRMEVKLYLEDWWYEGEGHRFASVGTLDRTAAVFSDLDRESLVLSAGQSQDIELRVRMPKDAEGGYYAVLFAESGIGGGTAAKMRLGALVMVETAGSPVPTLEVGEIRYLSEGGESSLLVDGKLGGITHGFVSAKGLIVDKDKGGMVDRVASEPLRFLPGQSRTVRIPLDFPLESGVYTFTGAADVDRTQSVKISSHFRVP